MICKQDYYILKFDFKSISSFNILGCIFYVFNEKKS